ncbi:unnamed protein product [Owenia fusiformis]|uniref:Uncharacterized protein n=1 Tax=Owenia fusiformis TaxID=6347 RepID=A0A8J1T5N1_OWEFU|nr:unnamed protein product [Owenia fusiformis]
MADYDAFDADNTEPNQIGSIRDLLNLLTEDHPSGHASMIDVLVVSLMLFYFGPKIAIIAVLYSIFITILQSSDPPTQGQNETFMIQTYEQFMSIDRGPGFIDLLILIVMVWCMGATSSMTAVMFGGLMAWKRIHTNNTAIRMRSVNGEENATIAENVRHFMDMEVVAFTTELRDTLRAWESFRGNTRRIIRQVKRNLTEERNKHKTSEDNETYLTLTVSRRRRLSL